LVVREARERAPAGVQGDIAARRRREGAGDVGEVRSPRDALVGDGVQPRQRRLHANRPPAATPRPRSQSAAAIRGFPAGWTSSTSTAPRPVAISSWPLAVSTSPGDPRPSATRAPNSFTSTLPASRLPPPVSRVV